MSGWVKLEKSLETDPRVLRMARRLAGEPVQQGLPLGAGDGAAPGVFGSQVGVFPRAVTLRRYTHAEAVTLVIGCLARLWMLADSHARGDDSLDFSAAELDELLGVPGLCAALPADWFVDHGDRVELPNFHTHNGVEARRRALTAKRVTRHRYTSVSTGNAAALPDQTRPDLDQTRVGGGAKAPRGHRLPEDFTLSPELEKFASDRGLDPGRTLEAFRDHWRAASGAKAVKVDWSAAFRTWCRRDEADGRGRLGPGAGERTRFDRLVSGLKGAGGG